MIAKANGCPYHNRTETSKGKDKEERLDAKRKVQTQSEEVDNEDIL